MGNIADLNELTVLDANDWFLVRDISDVADKDKKVKANKLPIKSGTPTAGRMASWLNGDSLQDSGMFAADIFHKSKVHLVDPAYTANASAKRYTTIGAAMSAAAAGDTILIAPGTYTETVTVSQDRISIVGSGAPSWNGSSLVGGTALVGQINCNSKTGVRVSDMGIDVRGTAVVDGIASGGAVTTAGQLHCEKIVFVGKGSGVSQDRGHAIVCSSGPGNVVRNCKFYLWYHGVAFRCTDSLVSDCYFYQCLGDSVIVKGDTGSGSAGRCTITNCVLDGDPASGFTRGGAIRVQNMDASTYTRWVTVSNITSTNAGEACILIQQIAGTCANIMVSNVVSYNAGDAASRSDFDVSGATDVHFVNCMSANRSNGWGFRSTGARVRAVNCSSDFTGAGRVADINTFDYADFGSGSGVDKAWVKNITFDQQTNPIAMRDMCLVTGNITTANGTPVDAITCLWTGNGNTAAITIDLLITYQSGSLARLLQYQIVVVRPNSTALVAAVQQVGSTLSTTGSGNNMTVAVNVATANTAIVQFTGVTGIGSASYTARINSLTTQSWTITAA